MLNPVQGATDVSHSDEKSMFPKAARVVETVAVGAMSSLK